MNKQKGFTLVELMIVIAVIGILASIGIPSYQNYSTQGKLIEATSTLSTGRVKMEQFFQDNRTYVNGTCPATTQNFTYACNNLTAASYTITATGIGGLSDFSYTIDQNNTRTSNTRWGSSASCWVIKSGGAC